MNRLRLAAVSAALAAAALPAPTAVAATPKTGTFKAGKGQVQRGYDLKFVVDKGGKRITKIVANVLETCSGESLSRTVTIAPDASWTVKRGKFSGRKKETFGAVTAYFTFEGKFTSATTATGKIRQETIVAGSVCDTYKLTFIAKR